MTTRMMRTTAVALFLAGAGVAALWISLAGGPELLGALRRAASTHVVALVGLTAACVGLRFLRWQYLLRRVGVRVPIRRNLVIYVASLAGIATPAYLGESLRSVLMRRAFGVPVRTTLAAWLLERLLDFAAILLLGAAALSGQAAGVGALAILAFVAVLAGRSADAGAVSSLRRPLAILPVFGLSVIAWLPAALVLPVSAAALGLPLDITEGVRVFASSTLGGGLSLMPAGMAATGSLAILQLQGIGWDAIDAVAAVSVFRLGTAGVTLVIAGVFLAAALRSSRRAPGVEEHFDGIASEYLDQFAPHIWDLLLERKTALMCSALPAPGGNAVGLDLGCGLGRQAMELADRGHRVIGLDPAFNLVRGGSREGLVAVTGSGLDLPFADGSLDFVYTVGVLHHLIGPGDQEKAISEVARVLRPGGVFIVHETNPRNPLFRLYMGYVFPILKSIDEGVERWLDPRRWSQSEDLTLRRTEYFTFLPDFLPRWLLRVALPVERWLERSRARVLSVHYMVVLRKPDPSPRHSLPAHADESAVVPA